MTRTAKAPATASEPRTADWFVADSNADNVSTMTPSQLSAFARSYAA